MSKGPVFRLYETEDRGLVQLLGDNPHNNGSTLRVVFQDSGPDHPSFGRIKVKDEDGNDIPEGLLAVERLEKTQRFIKGNIKYVPSPEERRAELKKQDQAKALGEYRELVAQGIFAPALDGKPDEDVRAFADKIGVNPEQPTKTLITEINKALGITGVGKIVKVQEPEPEPDEVPEPDDDAPKDRLSRRRKIPKL